MAENNRIHNIILEKRNRLNMSGVIEVVTFEDETIVLKTHMGNLTVKGEGLKIGSFSASSGDIDIDADMVSAIVYTDDEATKGGFFRRLMR